MYQNKQMALLDFCMFSFLLVQIFSVFMNRKVCWGFFVCLKKKRMLAYWLLYSFFLPCKILFFFFKEMSLMSAVLKFSFLVENLHTVMQYFSPGKIFMAYVNEIRPAPSGIDRMLKRKLTVY